MANRYWVGGTGTWSTTSTTNWASTTGGAGGASAPGSADTAFFDANSGTGTVTISENITLQRLLLTGSSIATIDWNNKSINLTGSGATIYTGNASVTMLNNPTINATYSGATGTRSITGGVSVPEASAINLNITAGTDIVSIGSGNNVYKNINFTGFSGTLAAGNRTLYGGIIYSSGMTVATSSGGLIFAATTGTHTITAANQAVDGLMTFSGGATYVFTNALTLTTARALTISAGTVKLKSGTTSVVGAFVTSGTTQKTLQSTLAGTQATLSDDSSTNTATYLTIKDINATGGATWSAYVTSNNVNDGNNTGWDFYLPTESIYDSLRLRGYTGTVTDMLLQYYKYNGATSNSIQDAESEYLVLKGFTTGTNTDKWYAYLRSLSYTGTVSDMLFNYWKDPA